MGSWSHLEKTSGILQMFNREGYNLPLVLYIPQGETTGPYGKIKSKEMSVFDHLRVGFLCYLGWPKSLRVKQPLDC